jgi:RHS repeat-associated protein
MTTTFNGALAQVLAQTPQAGSGGATYFVPGTGAQQTENVWRYLHSDGLGSVRHVTGAAGQAAGQMRYTPFGETAEQSGATSLFGFTGEPQGGLNDLVYLRARYYNPALGRFLTQDSLIPDVTNGQALNPYAYVYNDPINLVDPSGNIPAIGGSLFPIPPISLPSDDMLKAFVGAGAHIGLQGLDWYLSEPNCSCNGKPSNGFGFWGPIGGVGAQVGWGAATKPAGRYGSYIVEGRFQQQIASWWRQLPGMQSKLVNKLIPSHWGYKTVQGPWETWPGMSRTGWIDDVVPSGLNQADGTHHLTSRLRYRVASDVKWRRGLTGAAGATLVSGLIEGLMQGYLDRELCLSRAERAYRAAMSTGLGLAAGGAAALVFFGATALVAIPALGISAVGAVAIPALAAVGTGLWITIGFERFEVKEKLFGLAK